MFIKNSLSSQHQSTTTSPTTNHSIVALSSLIRRHKLKRRTGVGPRVILWIPFVGRTIQLANCRCQPQCRIFCIPIGWWLFYLSRHCCTKCSLTLQPLHPLSLCVCELRRCCCWLNYEVHLMTILLLLLQNETDQKWMS